MSVDGNSASLARSAASANSTSVSNKVKAPLRVRSARGFLCLNSCAWCLAALGAVENNSRSWCYDMKKKIPEVPPEFNHQMVERMHRLEDDLQTVFEAHKAGPSSSLALAVLARLVGQIIEVRSEHMSRIAAWRAFLKVAGAAQFLASVPNYHPSWTDSEFEAIGFFSGGESGEACLDDLLLKILAEGTGAVPRWEGRVQ